MGRGSGWQKERQSQKEFKDNFKESWDWKKLDHRFENQKRGSHSGCEAGETDSFARREEGVSGCTEREREKTSFSFTIFHIYFILFAITSDT